MSMNKFLQNSDDTPLHSSGYAEAANGDTMGATSNQTFQQRSQIEQGRQHIRPYRDSMVATGDHLREELRHRLENPENGVDDGKGKHKHKYKFNRQAYNASGGTPPVQEKPTSKQAPPTRKFFTEPDTKRYNPYQ